MLNYMSWETRDTDVYKYLVPLILEVHIDKDLERFAITSFEVLLYNISTDDSISYDFILKKWLVSERSFNPDNILKFIINDRNYFKMLIDFAKKNNIFTNYLENKLNNTFNNLDV